MRIAHLSPSLSRAGGGIPLIVRRLAQELLTLGNEEVVLALEDPFTEADAPKWSPVATRAFRPLGHASLGLSLRLYGELRRFAPEVVHRHSLWQGHSVAALAHNLQTRRPYVVTPHGTLDEWALSNSAWKKRIALRVYERAHLGRAACIHVNSTNEAEAVRRLGFANPICVIPNGVDVPTRTPTSPPPWEPDDRRVVLFLGRIHPKKGLAELIRGWTAAEGRGRLGEWRLVIAGWDDGGHEQGLRKLAHESSPRSIQFIGPVHGPAKAAALHEAAAFVLPSFSEGQPMAVLEAWSRRLPTLISPGCNLAVGYDKGAALRIEPSAEGVAAGLQELAAMSERQREQMGARAFALIQASFTWRKVAEQTAELYQWVIGGGSPPPTVLG